VFSDDGEYLIMLMIDYTFTCQHSRKKANKLELKNALKNVHIAPGQQFNLVTLSVSINSLNLWRFTRHR
jgi:hypothetical protein